MQHLIRFDDYTKDDVYEIFQIADEIKDGKYQKFLEGKTVILFFPNSSIRTRLKKESICSEDRRYCFLRKRLISGKNLKM